MSTAAVAKADKIVTDWQLVETPKLFPQACAVCRSARGPLVDTGFENVIGRIYMCRTCIVLAARMFGLIKGEKHTELVNASDHLDEARKDIAERETQIQKAHQTLAQNTNRIEALEQLLEGERAQTTSMRYALDLIGETAKQAKMTVTS